MLTAVPGEMGGTYDGCEGTVTYPFIYTDCEGNTHTWTYTYTIEYEDFTMPADAGSTLECYACTVIPEPPEVYDNCGILLTPVAEEVETTYHGCEGTVTYPFTYTDCEGNTHTWTYTYTIEYEDFTMPADAGSTVACHADAVMPDAPVVYDNCGEMLTAVPGEMGGTYDGCEGTVTYPFTYTDCEGNTHTWTYTYTIEYEDFTMPADAGSTLECYACTVIPEPPEVYDNCGILLTPVAEEVETTYHGCEGTVTYPFTYTDCEGNSHTWTYTYTIEYEDFTVPEDMSSTVACYADAATPTPPEVYDNCGMPLTPVLGEAGGTYDGCEGTIIYPFTYTDCVGNSHVWNYTYYLYDDVAPTWDQEMPGDLTVECNDIPLPTTVGATDNCEGNLTLTFNETVTGGSCLDEYVITRTWVAEDACENSITHTQVINVNDNTAPVIE